MTATVTALQQAFGSLLCLIRFGFSSQWVFRHFQRYNFHSYLHLPKHTLSEYLDCDKNVFISGNVFRWPIDRQQKYRWSWITLAAPSCFNAYQNTIWRMHARNAFHFKFKCK